mgnify:FL=1
MYKFTLRWLGFILLSVTSPLIAQQTYPANDIANPRSGYYAFTNATIIKDAKTTLTNATLLVKQGRIEAVGANLPIPKEAVVINCQGKFLYPSFIDAYSDYGFDAPQGDESHGR